MYVDILFLLVCVLFLFCILLCLAGFCMIFLVRSFVLSVFVFVILFFPLLLQGSGLIRVPLVFLDFTSCNMFSIFAV